MRRRSFVVQLYEVSGEILKIIREISVIRVIRGRAEFGVRQSEL